MADITHTHGDTSIGRPHVSTWKSGGQIVEIKVYKATSTETSAEFAARILDYDTSYLSQYPPD